MTMRITVRFIAILLVALSTSACVTGTRSIELATPEQVASTPAKGSVYIAQIVDQRTFEQKPAQASTPSVNGNLASTSAEQRSKLIGRQRNGFGKAMGDVALANDGTVQGEVRRLLEQGFAGRGYSIANSPDGALVANVEIRKFWAWFRPGFWSVGFDADIDCHIGIEGDGSTKSIDVQGHGLNKGQVASDANWQEAFEMAFSEFLKNLDTALEQAGL
jgi:hypothetical protein